MVPNEACKPMDSGKARNSLLKVATYLGTLLVGVVTGVKLTTLVMVMSWKLIGAYQLGTWTDARPGVCSPTPGEEGSIQIASGGDPIAWPIKLEAIAPSNGDHSTIAVGNPLGTQIIANEWDKRKGDVDGLLKVRAIFWNGRDRRCWIRKSNP